MRESNVISNLDEELDDVIKVIETKSNPALLAISQFAKVYNEVQQQKKIASVVKTKYSEVIRGNQTLTALKSDIILKRKLIDEVVNDASSLIPQAKAALDEWKTNLKTNRERLEKIQNEIRRVYKTDSEFDDNAVAIRLAYMSSMDFLVEYRNYHTTGNNGVSLATKKDKILRILRVHENFKTIAPNKEGKREMMHSCKNFIAYSVMNLFCGLKELKRKYMGKKQRQV